MRKKKDAKISKSAENTVGDSSISSGNSCLAAEQIAAITVDVKVFCRGVSFPNPGEAGSGLAVFRADELSELWYGLYCPVGTNQKAELVGLHHALLASKEELDKGKTVAVFSSSKYSIDWATKWAGRWAKKGWKIKGKRPMNVELIIPMRNAYEELNGRVKIYHVSSSSESEGIDLAYRMCELAVAAEEFELRLYKKSLG